jgi:hypothetical protein
LEAIHQETNCKHNPISNWLCFRDLEVAVINIDSYNPLDSPTSEQDYLQALDFRNRNDGRFSAAASRILYSDFYRWFYVSMTVLSILAFAISFWHKWYLTVFGVVVMQNSDSSLYWAFEILLNGVMILEIGIRMLAMRQVRN